MKVLVTGGAGFIGSHVVDRFLGEGFEVVVLDNLRSGSIDNIGCHMGKANFEFVQGDIRNACLVGNLVMDVDYVVHLAALVSVPESLRDPGLTTDINVNGTLNLLKASVDMGVKKFVYASSCAVYGNAEKLPIREDCPIKPESPYGVSKLTAENYVRGYFEEFGLETVCLRNFNVYGLRQAYSYYSGVITQFLNCIKRGLPLVVFGDGEQTRDFVYVDDVVEANLLALRCEKAAGEVFNIGTGMTVSVNQLVNTLLEILGRKGWEVVHREAREGNIRHSVADISKARGILGFNPRVQLKDGLAKLVGKCC